MKGNEQVIELLNEVLTAELTAINQYFIHSEMCESMGFGVPYLEGHPNMTRYFPIKVGKSVDKLAQQVRPGA